MAYRIGNRDDIDLNECPARNRFACVQSCIYATHRPVDSIRRLESKTGVQVLRGTYTMTLDQSLAVQEYAAQWDSMKRAHPR